MLSSVRFIAAKVASATPLWDTSEAAILIHSPFAILAFLSASFLAASGLFDEVPTTISKGGFFLGMISPLLSWRATVASVKGENRNVPHNPLRPPGSFSEVDAQLDTVIL